MADAHHHYNLPLHTKLSGELRHITLSHIISFYTLAYSVRDAHSISHLSPAIYKSYRGDLGGSALLNPPTFLGTVNDKVNHN
jgi:hypothetical protein